MLAAFKTRWAAAAAVVLVYIVYIPYSRPRLKDAHAFGIFGAPRKSGIVP